MITPEQAVDKLGVVCAQMAALKAQKDSLRLMLISSGREVVEGQLYRGTVSEAEVNTTNWKTVAERMGPSHQLVSAHTTSSKRTQVRVVSRNGKKGK
jgi:hypothetical protein